MLVCVCISCVCVSVYTSIYIDIVRGEPALHELKHSAFLPSPGECFLYIPPVFHLYPGCILPCSWYPAVSLYRSLSSHFAADPLYPAVCYCIQLYPYVSSCIPLYLIVSHRLKKRDMAKNTLQWRAEARVCSSRANPFFVEGFERSPPRSSPLEKTRSKLANPVELAVVFTGVASFDGDLRIGIFFRLGLL